MHNRRNEIDALQSALVEVLNAVEAKRKEKEREYDSFLAKGAKPEERIFTFGFAKGLAYVEELLISALDPND